MTLVVLHRTSLGHLPYGQWLADSGHDLVVVTEPGAETGHTAGAGAEPGRAEGGAASAGVGAGRGGGFAAVPVHGVEVRGVEESAATAGIEGRRVDRVAASAGGGAGRSDGFATVAAVEVHCIGRFAATAAVELAVLEIAARRPVTAVIALHPGDQIRAGSLRDHLGLAGQTRDEAVVGADAIRAAELLGAAGVPVVPRAAAGTIADLYRAAHAWGRPLVVRRRRGPERAVVAELAGEAELRAFARGGIAEGDTAATAGLTVEPATAGPRHRGPGNPATDAALAVLPAAPGHPLEVEAVRDESGTWRVDTARYTGRTAPARELVRAQAGLDRVRPQPAYRESMEAV
ncbi:hypothetical protein OHB14_34490 [Streptomyces sp. NBC_01613]|uniref:hypothetical protein n=1 Tax=Streptomyces sp. NBC_01613 TaxID=2975896 RepID=UPI00386349B9